MLNKMFKEFGDEPIFRNIINSMLDSAIMDVNNDLKFKKIDIDDDIVGSVLLMVINRNVGFEFLKTINLVLNGANEDAYGNVNEFIDKLTLMYGDAENKRDEFLKNEGLQ